MMEMETKYYQKVKRQTHQYLVISLLFLLGFSSCGVQKINRQLKKDSYQVINQELNYLMDSERYNDFLLARKLNNHAAELNIDRLEFSELEKSKIVFSENKIYIEEDIEKKQLDILNDSNLEIIDLEKKPQNYVLNSTKELIILSKPFFSESKKYAVITNYFGNILGGGTTSVTIYKKENNRWIVYRRILLMIG